VRSVVEASGITTGLCHLFIRHTSASLLINENADPDVLRDLETFMSDLVADGDSRFIHTAEGPDDMPAHVRCALTQTSLSIPVMDGRLALGTWQGIYLWEHRHRPHDRQVVVTVVFNQ
jgi:secondary thiamine-phosphate synthase enzyme